MHEVSLGYTIADYLSGGSVEATTYEDLRQAIARMLVERKGYPLHRLRSKVQVTFPVGEGTYTRTVDLVAYDAEGRPLVLILFCAGEVETYVREAVAAARLMEEGAPPLAVVTDTKSAVLVSVGDKRHLEHRDYQALPDWDRLHDLAGQVSGYELNDKRRIVEGRLLYALSELTTCCGDDCQTGDPEGS
ncbi:MAG: type I restriction enzyme HsdR N-terminal domain-containing protein [Desulfohalobiaceae bacterium]|nr:type I restriction enzyme HsdR N-terminal domain-containing protein [Desulfohalobiaceae bacterium]